MPFAIRYRHSGVFLQSYIGALPPGEMPLACFSTPLTRPTREAVQAVLDELCPANNSRIRHMLEIVEVGTEYPLKGWATRQAEIDSIIARAKECKGDWQEPEVKGDKDERDVTFSDTDAKPSRIVVQRRWDDGELRHQVTVYGPEGYSSHSFGDNDLTVIMYALDLPEDWWREPLLYKY